MHNLDELFDVVDEHDCVIGQAARREVHLRQLNHRAIHIFLFNDHGELYLQKRAATKDSFPGCYDSSASGHLGVGEDYDACATRELHEELGVNVPFKLLTKQFKLPAGADTGAEFVWVYSLRGNYQPVPNPDEIEDGKFFTIAEVRKLIEQHPEQCAPAFRRIFCEFSSRGLLPA